MAQHHEVWQKKAKVSHTWLFNESVSLLIYIQICTRQAGIYISCMKCHLKGNHPISGLKHVGCHNFTWVGCFTIEQDFLTSQLCLGLTQYGQLNAISCPNPSVPRIHLGGADFRVTSHWMLPPFSSSQQPFQNHSDDDVPINSDFSLTLLKFRHLLLLV